MGLQVWRGALLLNDFILHNPDKFSNKTVLELGSGVGISSIVASIYAKKVICTDINIGGILDLIRRNLELNKHYQREKKNIEVMELNFLDEKYETKLDSALKSASIALAADGEKLIKTHEIQNFIYVSFTVIYDNRITDGFIKTVVKLFKNYPLNELYIALEKRFVFTDSVCAPMYEYFVDNFKTEGFLRLDEVPTTFPQFFDYDRCKELILMRVSRT